VKSPKSIDEVSSAPWALDMKACAQDARWHAEGDVWTHTQRVFNALLSLECYQQLSPQEQAMLKWAAILHDVGKPATTKEEEGGITAKKHARIGSVLARVILRDAGIPPQQRERICTLVRYHAAPVFCLEHGPYKAIELSWLANCKLLYVLAKADDMGRDTDSKDHGENIELFKILCEEHNCFDAPYKFVNDQARFLFFRNQLTSLFYTPHEDYRCRATMLAGLPGAGKSTLRNKSCLPYINLDELRKELKMHPAEFGGPLPAIIKGKCLWYLRDRQDFIFDATNLIKDERSRWLDLFAKYNARTCCIWVEPSWETILKQNQNRKMIVPEDWIEGLFSRMDPPTMTEFHEVEFIGDH
jgi:putative nucleotidyltransferase with HDIG domain